MLKIEDIDVYYGQLKVLHDVTLTVGERELVAVIGSNGAGKTTLLKSICGLLKPQKGHIRFRGADITGTPTHKIVESGISYVPEGRRLFPYLTVIENLEVGACISRARKEMKETLKTIYQIFPILKERRDQLAGTLSGGEQQMLAIGRALMSRPELLLLDEPSLGLAPVVIQKLFQTIKAIQEEGTSMILVEQNARQALKICDRAYVIETGKIILEGAGQDLLRDERIRKAYLGVR